MDIVTTPFLGLFVLKPLRLEDGRGFFCENYSKRRLEEAGVYAEFVQDNLSLSKVSGTLRGLHFQRAPMAQAKLVGILQGLALDVVVDLRRSSQTFGKQFSYLLNPLEGHQLFIPAGFAHGFVTLAPDTLFAYKVSNYYSPEHDAGIRFDDPSLRVDWGSSAEQFIISERDRALPSFDPTLEYFP